MSLKLSFETWGKFIQGDHTCYEKIFKKYYQGLYGYGLKLCFDSGLVQDCIQDLFVSIWERRNELTHIKSPNVYLYVSLRRNILKAVKKQKREKEISDQIDETPEIEFGIDELIIKKETRMDAKQELHKALNRLTNQQKEVIYLHFYNGMSYGEIEEILSINRQSVKNHVHKAMQTLRKVLDIPMLRLIAVYPLFFLMILNISLIAENWKSF